MIATLASVVIASCQAIPPPTAPTPDARLKVDAFIASQVGPKDPDCFTCTPTELTEGRQYLLRDVTRDGLPDVIVLYHLEEGLNWTPFLGVFDGVGVRLIDFQAVGGKGYRAAELASASSDTIELQVLLYADTDALCCPSIPATTRYQIIDGKLSELAVDVNNRSDLPRVRWEQW